jgi:hypothetical protein
MLKIYDQTLDVHAMITPRLHYGFFPFIHSDLFLSLFLSKPKTVPIHPYYILAAFVMAPVVHLEPNGYQALLSHDDAIKHLRSQG